MSFFRENCKDEIGREVEWAILELQAKWVLGLMIMHTALPTIRRPKNMVALWKDARFFMIESQLGVFNESSEMEQTREHCTSLSRNEIEGAECGVLKYWWNHSGLICLTLLSIKSISYRQWSAWNYKSNLSDDVDFCKGTFLSVTYKGAAESFVWVALCWSCRSWAKLEN